MSPRRLLAALLLLVPLPAAAGQYSPNFYPDGSCTPKDFAFVRHDGWFHVFYIRHHAWVPFEQNETELGHAMSQDFLSWTYLPPVLPVRPDSWDRSHVWAPSIVRKDGLYYMFYTGVSCEPGLPLTQSIGVATSPDLMEWTRRDAPVYTLASAPWAYADTTTDRATFRDPFVMADPAQPGRWLMYFCAAPRIDTLSMVVGMAESDDLLHWSDRGPLWTTHVTAAAGDSTTESPHLFDHDGTWYLFYSAYATTQLRWWTGPDPTGPPETWTYHGDVTSLFLGDSWVPHHYASESLRDGTLDYFAFIGPGTIEFRQIRWDGQGSFLFVPPDLRHVVSMAWDRAWAAENDSVPLTLVTVHPDGLPIPIEAVRLRSDGGETPVAPAALGLPEAVTPVSDTTRLVWRARWVADPQDTARDMRLVVRLAERTAATGPIAITPQPPLELVSMTWEPGTVAYDGRATLSLAARHTVLRRVALETALVTDAGPVPVTPHAVGLPDTLALAGDTTRVVWDARWYAEPADTGRSVTLPPTLPPGAAPLRLAVRPAGGGIAAQSITVPPPGPLGGVALRWDADSVAGDGVATLTLTAANGRGRVLGLEATRQLGSGPVPVESIGLPAGVALSGDTTRVTWAARWLADPADPLLPMTLTVQVAGQGPAAPPLVVVRPAALQVVGLAWSRDTVAHDSTAVLSIAAHHWRWQSVTLRTGRLVQGKWVSVPPDSFGLPARVTLTDEVTTVPWTACWRSNPPDTTSPLGLMVGIDEGSALAPMLVVQPPRFEVLGLCWDSLRIRIGNPARLSVAARHWRWRTVILEGRTLEPGGEAPISLAALGLPEELLLTSDTTRVQWTAALPPGRPDSTMVLLVRIPDSGARAASVAVLGAGSQPAAVADEPVVREGLRLVREGREWSLAVSLRGAVSDVRIDLFDAQGRHVRRLHGGPLPAGLTRVRWDGRSEAGAASPAGLYFARLTSPRLRATARLVRLR